MLVDALTIANTILERAKEENKDITPMKLQKLIYCLYKEYYKRFRIPMFNERFEVWKYGPVLRSVYDAFKEYGSNAIKDFAKSSDGSVYVIDQKVSKNFKVVFDKIWDLYSDYNGIVLSALTHQENTAWRKAFDRRQLYLTDSDIACEDDYVRAE